MSLIVNNKTTIYVLSLAYYKTGGLELLHQLVFTLNSIGYNSKMVYYNLKKKNNINKEFLRYIDTYYTDMDVVDDENNILVVPETRVQFLDRFKKIRKVVWWLSVDNYFFTQSIANHYRKFGLLKTIKHKIFYKDKFKDWNLNVIADEHLVQSEYARLYLLENGVEKISNLSDYLNDTYLNKQFDIDTKEDIVLYNPAKGYEFTRKIIEMADDIKWIPLVNMSTEEVSETLLKGKVYIDFGNHPGKDRFPREAAMSGCCIITGKKGAAENEIDIRIPDEYKFDESLTDINMIIDKIRYILNDYENEIRNFEEYRNYIVQEKKQFMNDIVSFFVKK